MGRALPEPFPRPGGLVLPPLRGCVREMIYEPAGESGRREEGRVQYLVTMDFVDPGPLLPPQQFLGMVRQAVLPGHEALINLKSEGKIVAGGFPLGERGHSVNF